MAHKGPKVKVRRDAFKALAVRQHLSMREIAAKAHIGRSYLSSLVNGQDYIGRKSREQLMMLFRVDFDTLFEIVFFDAEIKSSDNQADQTSAA